PVRAKGILDGGDHKAASLEGSARFRHHLFRLGINLPGDPSRGARSAAISPRRHSLLFGWNRALWLDAGQGNSITPLSSMVRRLRARCIDLCFRLRISVLG